MPPVSLATSSGTPWRSQSYFGLLTIAALRAYGTHAWSWRSLRLVGLLKKARWHGLLNACVFSRWDAQYCLYTMAPLLARVMMSCWSSPSAFVARCAIS